MSNAPLATLVCCGLIGTAVADDGLVERAFAEAIATAGIVTGTSAYTRCMVQVHRHRGQSTADVMNGLFPGNQARAQAAQLVFDRAFGAAVARMGVAPVAGARKAIEQLSGAGLHVCLITGLSRRLLGLVLDAVGLRDCVDLALSADDVPRGCPSPDLVLAAMLRLGVGDVHETVVAHGAESGLLCGRRAGAGLVAGVLTGPHPAARLRGAGAHHLVTSLSDLPDLVAMPPQARQDAVPLRREPPSAPPAGSAAVAGTAEAPGVGSASPVAASQARSARAGRVRSSADL
jgi:phosphonatase-like hydrolase